MRCFDTSINKWEGLGEVTLLPEILTKMGHLSHILKSLPLIGVMSKKIQEGSENKGTSLTHYQTQDSLFTNQELPRKKEHKRTLMIIEKSREEDKNSGNSTIIFKIKDSTSLVSTFQPLMKMIHQIG